MGYNRIEFFPRDILNLQKEIRKHPDLVNQLLECKDLSEWFAKVAAYAEVAMDGYYYPEEFPKICKILQDKLFIKRCSIVITAPSHSMFPQ